jgi:hypothetical protein
MRVGITTRKGTLGSPAGLLPSPDEGCRDQVKSPGVVFDGYRVIFVSGQALSAGMVGAVTSSLVDSVVVGRMRQRARTSRPR